MPKETARETQMHFLEFEFGSLQKALDKFDGLRFQIKNWAVTVTAAVLALSVNAKDYRIALVGFAIVPLFAYVEVLNMHIQSKFISRTNRLEDLLDSMIRTDGPLASAYKFGIGRELELGTFDLKGLVKTLRGRPHIYVLYLGLLAAISIVVLLLILA